MKQVYAWFEQWQPTGKIADGGIELQPRETAKTVRAGANGQPVITDGPYLESKEHLGGFWVVDVPDLDAAIELARRGSAACQGVVEVRPFQPEPAA